MRSERLLVSMKNYIGDAVLTEPMLSALEAHYARVEIHAGSPVDQVLWRPGPPRRFTSMARPSSIRDLFAQAKSIRNRSYDVAILVNHSFRSALTARLAGVPRRIGHATEGRGLLLTDVVPYSPDRFELLNQLDLARVAGAEVLQRMPTLSTTPDECYRGAQLGEGCTVGFQPGARWAGKKIPLEVSIAISRELVAAGEKVALLGGSEERSDAETVADAVGRNVVVLVGKTSVRESLGLLTTFRGMIGSDTGLMHLAAGVGCPTVTVFGPTSAVKWGHHYSPHRVLEAPDRVMANVNPAMVLDVFREVLRAA